MSCSNNFCTFFFGGLVLPPDHFVDDAGVALDDFDDLRRYVFFDVVGHGDSVIAVGVHRDGGINGLQERFLVNSRDKEACLVKRFGAFRAGADADSRERVTDAREEGAFFGQGAAVAHNGEGVHLQEYTMFNGMIFDIWVILPPSDHLCLDHRQSTLSPKYIKFSKN